MIQLIMIIVGGLMVGFTLMGGEDPHQNSSFGDSWWPIFCFIVGLLLIIIGALIHFLKL